MATCPLVCTFESRRADEMQRLIEKFGGEAFVAPSMQEVPIENNSEATETIRKIVAGQVSAMVLLTGVGTEAMIRLANLLGLQEELTQQMAAMPLLVRGPKPAAALSKLGLKHTVKAPEPNTWEQLIEAIQDSDVDLSGSLVAVQEYGISNVDLNAALEKMGADVLRVPVYRWSLPDNTIPLQEAVQKTIQGEFAALMFTSAQQVRHVLQIAEQLQASSDFLHAANKGFVASIGPTCSETLKQCDLKVSFEASPPKMGPFVRGTMEAVNQQQ